MAYGYLHAPQGFSAGPTAGPVVPPLRHPPQTYAYEPAYAPGPAAHPGPAGQAQAAEQARRIGRIVNVVGALASVVLLAGLGFWSYRLMVRDVSGVPVVRALDGPMRVSPDEPGGRQTAFQGLAVNAVAAQGGNPTPSREIALAPPPIDIQPQDRLAILTAPSAAAAPAEIPTPEPVAEPQDMLRAAVEMALADGPVGPGLARSPVPPRRPARFGGQASVAVSAPTSGADPLVEAALQDIVTRRASAQEVTEIDPTSLTAGTRLVQLGAFESEAEARAAWGDLSARFPGQLDGRGRVVEAATAGGRVFFRLRAHGFRDEPEARRFCAAFITENLDCTPVLIR